MEIEKYDRERDARYEDGEPIPLEGIQLEIEFPEKLYVYGSFDRGKTWKIIHEI